MEILLVLKKPQDHLNRRIVEKQGLNFVITIVSRDLFEKDVKKGFLGDFVASFLLLPHKALRNPGYLEQNETEFKKRVVREELNNLSLRFGSLFTELLIDPPFFYHQRVQRRIKIRQLSGRNYLSSNGYPNEDRSFGFLPALKELDSSGLINLNHYARATEKLIQVLPGENSKALVPFREVEHAVRRLAAYGTAVDLLDRSILNDFSETLKSPEDMHLEMPDPKSFLYLKTEGGMVSMDDERGVKEIISSECGHEGEGSMRRIGGALNYVYLVELENDGLSRKLVAKSYQNWYGLKWVPVTLWTIGAQNFDVSGKRRLANEYKMNRYLGSKGINVPAIYHISMPKLTIIEQYIEGRGFDEVVKEFISKGRQASLMDVENLGEEIGDIHSLGASLGDSKPDNMIVDAEGHIWFVDLEQAAREGNPSWDLAEFLYYSGHYTLRWSKMKPVVESFLRGYEKSGDMQKFKDISKAKYKRVFGLITPPHIIMEISRLSNSL